MKKINTKKQVLVGSILIVVLMLSIAVYTVGQDGTTVFIQDCSVPPGDTVTVPIMINDVSKIMTADVNLSFDSSVVHVLSASDSDFDAMIPNIDNTSGWIRIGAFQLLSGALSGDVVLANLTLQAVGNAADVSPLNFTHICLENETAVEIPATPDNGTFTVEDIVPPEISNINANPDPQETGGYVNITCDVSDNVAVDEVWVNITYPDSSMHNFSMNPGSYYYNQIYSILGTYNYFIWANDTSNNENTSSIHSFTIQEDTILPEIMNVQDSPDPQETGGYVNITCDVSDNVAVDEVWVNITYPDSSMHNFSMNPGSYYYNQTYSILGTYNYFIWANDTSNNENTSSIHSFTIQDTTPPPADQVKEVPAISPIGIIILIGLLAIIGSIFIKRMKY